MPKKTRKQKIASQRRRLIKAPVQELAATERDEPLATIETTQPFYKADFSKTKPTKSEDLSINYSYVTSDLKRIGIIAILTIVLEIGLNLTLRTNFAKLLLLSLGIEI